MMKATIQHINNSTTGSMGKEVDLMGHKIHVSSIMAYPVEQTPHNGPSLPVRHCFEEASEDFEDTEAAASSPPEEEEEPEDVVRFKKDEVDLKYS
jgi:hypothetical protein